MDPLTVPFPRLHPSHLPPLSPRHPLTRHPPPPLPPARLTPLFVRLYIDRELGAKGMRDEGSGAGDQGVHSPAGSLRPRAAAARLMPIRTRRRAKRRPGA
jgi:hypothetical protein